MPPKMPPEISFKTFGQTGITMIVLCTPFKEMKVVSILSIFLENAIWQSMRWLQVWKIPSGPRLLSFKILLKEFFNPLVEGQGVRYQLFHI